VLTVEFTVAGVPCIGLNGGPAFKHNEAFSFQIATDDQDETDRYWNAIAAQQSPALLRCAILLVGGADRVHLDSGPPGLPRGDR
jgi:predicted 3-demethylubiquinone-9 3-methyltransferase (glyoxalase superfamily)